MSRTRYGESLEDRSGKPVTGEFGPGKYFSDIQARDRSVDIHKARKPELHDAAYERIDGLNQHQKARAPVGLPSRVRGSGHK